MLVRLGCQGDDLSAGKTVRIHSFNQNVVLSNFVGTGLKLRPVTYCRAQHGTHHIPSGRNEMKTGEKKRIVHINENYPNVLKAMK